MKKDVERINIDSTRVAIANDFFGESSNRINYMVQDSETNFEGLKKTGVMNKNLNQVQKGYLEIQQSLKGYAKVLNDYYNDLDSMEKEYIELINGIKVPKDFRLNSSFSVNGASSVTLRKEDGKSINSDNNRAINDVLNDEELINKQNLEDIKNEETQKKEYDDTSIIQKENIGNINNQENLDVKELDNETSINQEERLGMLNTNSDTNIRENDNASIINEVNLENIENNHIEPQSFIDNNQTVHNEEDKNLYENEQEKENSVVEENQNETGN